jgi:hypothetical protein
MLDGNITTPDGGAAAAAAAPNSFYSLDGLKNEFVGLGDRVGKILDPMRQLESSGEQLVETFGYAGERLKVMETQINSSATSILGLSKNAKTYEEAMKRAGEIIKEVSVATNRNVIVSSEVIKSLELTAEATGVKTSDLAKNFGDVGIQLSDVKNKMEIATSVAQKMGVNVGAVAKGVSDNLKNLTIYNFQNGVEGLAKMVAKSAVLGVNMEHVFTMAEKAFDPEQAIELAADMQRLGVATSDLLDPLKIMDLGQNNPEELMNQIVNVTKGLTKIDEKSGQVKILPGEMGRMRELAKAMGMSAKELAEMAIKSGELEYKMKKIQFPELKAPMDEKTREMIANLASFKEGEGFVVDVGGEIKQVSTLSETDIKLLEEQAQPKTMEQLAQDQLTVSQKIFKTLEFIASAPRSGLARGEAGQKYRREMDDYADILRTGAFKKDKEGDFHDKMAKELNDAAETILKDLPKNMFDAITNSMPANGEKFDFNKFQKALEEVFKQTGENLKENTKGAGNAFGGLASNIMKEYGEYLKVKAEKQIPKLPGAPQTTTLSTEKKEPELNWHETLDKTMEDYKKSMEPTTTEIKSEEKTPEQIQEEKQKQDFEAMEDLFSSFVEKTGTPVIDMKPLMENGIAQNDRLIEKLDELIEAVNENKLEIDYDKFGVDVTEDTDYVSLFEPMINKLSEVILSQKETINALDKITSIDFPKQIEIPKKTEEPLIVENKVETPPITETPKIEITNEPFNLPEPFNMDGLISSFSEIANKFETPVTDFSPIMGEYGLQTDKIRSEIASLIDATKENKLDIDYDKFKTETTDNIDYTSIFDSNLKPINQILTEFQKNNEPKSVNPTIVEKLETKEIEKQPIVEIKKEEKTEQQPIEVKTEPYKIPEPTDNKDVIASLNGLGEQLKFPTTDLSPLVSEYGLQTDKLIDTLIGLREDTKENKFSIDYGKFTTGRNEENFSQIFEPTMNKLGQFISEQERLIGVKNPEPTKIEKTELINETIKEKEFVEIKPEITKMPEFDTNSIASAISNQTDKFVDNLNSLKETTKENKMNIDYDKFASKTSSNEDFITLITPLMDKFGDAFTSVENKVSGIKNPEPTIVENKEIKTNEIIKETEFVEIKPEITKMPEFDTNSIASAISNQTDKFSDNLNSLKETTKENKIDIDYNKFISNTSPDKNYLTLIQPMIDKFGDAFTSVENKISGIKNFEPTVVEKQELKEIKIEQEPLKIESFKETPMIAPEKNMAGVTIDGLQKINESKLPESAKTNIPEITPQTFKTESTTNVGGEITVVVDVRGVQNDASRLIIDEVTKKINSGEFTNALITQIKNKESAYGQLAGQQYTTPPGFV